MLDTHHVLTARIDLLATSLFYRAHLLHGFPHDVQTCLAAVELSRRSSSDTRYLANNKRTYAGRTSRAKNQSDYALRDRVLDKMHCFL